MKFTLRSGNCHRSLGERNKVLRQDLILDSFEQRYLYFTKQVLVLYDGYIISSLGPLFTDSLNNNAAILKHYILNNEQQVLSWLRDNDVLVLDREVTLELTGLLIILCYIIVP